MLIRAIVCLVLISHIANGEPPPEHNKGQHQHPFQQHHVKVRPGGPSRIFGWLGSFKLPRFPRFPNFHKQHGKMPNYHQGSNGDSHQKQISGWKPIPTPQQFQQDPIPQTHYSPLGSENFQDPLAYNEISNFASSAPLQQSHQQQNYVQDIEVVPSQLLSYDKQTFGAQDFSQSAPQISSPPQQYQQQQQQVGIKTNVPIVPQSTGPDYFDTAYYQVDLQQNHGDFAHGHEVSTSATQAQNQYAQPQPTQVETQYQVQNQYQHQSQQQQQQFAPSQQQQQQTYFVTAQPEQQQQQFVQPQFQQFHPSNLDLTETPLSHILNSVQTNYQAPVGQFSQQHPTYIINPHPQQQQQRQQQQQQHSLQRQEQPRPQQHQGQLQFASSNQYQVQIPAQQQQKQQQGSRSPYESLSVPGVQIVNRGVESGNDFLEVTADANSNFNGHPIDINKLISMIEPGAQLESVPQFSEAASETKTTFVAPPESSGSNSSSDPTDSLTNDDERMKLITNIVTNKPQRRRYKSTTTTTTTTTNRPPTRTNQKRLRSKIPTSPTTNNNPQSPAANSANANINKNMKFNQASNSPTLATNSTVSLNSTGAGEDVRPESERDLNESVKDGSEMKESSLMDIMKFFQQTGGKGYILVEKRGGGANVDGRTQEEPMRLNITSETIPRLEFQQSEQFFNLITPTDKRTFVNSKGEKSFSPNALYAPNNSNKLKGEKTDVTNLEGGSDEVVVNNTNSTNEDALVPTTFKPYSLRNPPPNSFDTKKILSTESPTQGSFMNESYDSNHNYYSHTPSTTSRDFPLLGFIPGLMPGGEINPLVDQVNNKDRDSSSNSYGDIGYSDEDVAYDPQVGDDLDDDGSEFIVETPGDLAAAESSMVKSIAITVTPPPHLLTSTAKYSKTYKLKNRLKTSTAAPTYSSVIMSENMEKTSSNKPGSTKSLEGSVVKKSVSSSSSAVAAGRSEGKVSKPRPAPVYKKSSTTPQTDFDF